MRRIFLALVAAAGWSAMACAASTPGNAVFTSPDSVQRWIYTYRVKPDLARFPHAVLSMSRMGVFKDPESAGIYVGFIAGVIGSNPTKATHLVEKMLALPPEDQWVVVRAVAYSTLPNWKDVLRKFAARMPSRRVMIDMYLAGQLPSLNEIAMEKKTPTFMETAKSIVTMEKYFGKDKPKTSEMTFSSSPELLDTLWGLYFATGNGSPIERIVLLLPWSVDKNDIEKLTIGNMARYTLATNASRDAKLLGILKAAAPKQAKEVQPILNEVILAADTVDTARLRKEALAAVDEFKRKGPGYKRDVALWGQVGEGAISLGCIAAAASGAVALGLPCVVGGALSSAALRYFASP